MILNNIIQKALIENKPAEKGGAINEERLTYQKDWAICKLIELHSKEEDYLMIFEYHDDVLILDNSDNPSLISFYQIKTKTTGNWTTKSLLDKQKKVNSYLGKLYLNKIKFPDIQSILNFVSNARFSVKLNNPSHKSIDFSKICLSELSVEEIEVIIENLKKELDNNSQIIVDNTFFHVSDIPVNNSETSSIAALVEYFEKNTARDSIPRLKPLHETLINEIRRKSKFTYEVATFEDLITYRSITRDEFQDILMLALKKSSKDFKKIQEQIFQRLNAETESIKRIQQFARSSNQYLLDKLDISNEVINRLENEIHKIISTFSDEDFEGNLVPCSDKIYNKLIFSDSTYNYLEKSYIVTVIMFQLYGSYEL